VRQANGQAKSLPKDDLLRADIADQLGFMLCQLNEIDEAETHFRGAVDIREMALQPNDNSTAVSLNMLGFALQVQGKLEEAERVGERAINMFRVSPNKDDKHYDIALENLAQTLRLRGKFEASETMFRESLEIKRRTFGKNHEETAKSKFAVLTHSCVIL
jgi:tetratricopeptide (TPR) repeat protein